MSCMTRKMQQNLARYLKRNSKAFSSQPVEQVRNDLVSKGLCPSDVTPDQLRTVMKSAFGC